MPRAPKSNKPAPFGVEPVRCRATRGPNARGQWYWRAVTYSGGEESPAWAGWATRDEAYRRTVEHVANGTAAPAAPEGFTLPERPTIRDLLETWIPVVRARPDVPAMTVTTYRRSARRLLRFAGDWLISELRATALQDLAQQMRATLAPNSVRLSFVVLDLALKWGRPRGWISPDVELPKVPKDLVREKYTPTREEVLAVFWRLPPKWWYRAAYRLLWATGMRVTCECGALLWGDVDIVQDETTGKPIGRIHVPDGKTGRRWVYVDPSIVHELERLGRGLPDQRIFPRTHFRKRLQKAIDRAREKLEADGMKVPRWTTHGFRRAAIRAGRRAGVDVVVTAAMMGNSPQTIFDAYEEANEEDVRRAAAQVKLGTISTREREKS